MAVPGWLLVALGLVSFAIATAFARRARRQLQWSQVPATITRSNVILSAGYFSADVEYTYVYEGRQFRGSKVRSLEISVNWRSPSRKTAARYRVSSSATAFVNPDFPSEAVLEPGGDSWFVPFCFVFCSIPVLIGAGLIAKG
jgi:hypothetical protein